MKLLKFIGLKVLECAAIFYIPCGFGLLFDKMGVSSAMYYEDLWLWFRGIFPLILCGAVFVLLVILFFGILMWININWQWSHDGESIKWIDDVFSD